MTDIPTPRTDAELVKMKSHYGEERGDSVNADFAAQLEREIQFLRNKLGLIEFSKNTEGQWATEILKQHDDMRRAAAKGRSEGHEEGK